MKLELAVAAPFAALARRADNGTFDYSHAPPNLSTVANNSLFETWRPKAHVLPPSGHIGDPCMHYTDNKTGLFHVGFLHNGGSGATTDDLTTYHDVNPAGAPFIQAGGINDPVAVFDGSVIPQGINGDPTLLYTSVSFLPIQWTINYTRGSETQSLAVSTDGGRNFTKLPQGPVIPGPPFALNVTGFRDIYVFQHPPLDEQLNSKDGTWYAVASGGVHDEGPSQFLYRQYDAEFQYWEYLGQWWHEPANSTWGEGKWAGRWGFNFEVGNVFSLDSDGYNPEGEIFTTLGAEWSEIPIIPQVSQFREQLWAAGNVTTHANGTVKFDPTMAGKLDWGVFAYAAAGKLLPSSSKASLNSGAPDRFIVYLWLTGTYYDQSDFPINQQGWDSALLLPRELSIGTIHDVVDNELVQEIGSWRVSEPGAVSGTVNLATLRQEIAREPLATFVNSSVRSFSEPGREVKSATGSNNASVSFSHSPQSRFYLMTASVQFPASARNSSDTKAGFTILSSQYESTKIYYQFSNESVIIDRSNSSAAALTSNGFDSRNEAGHLRLFDIANKDGTTSIEQLDLTIVVDNSVVEVFANDRFVLSSWIWAWYDSSNQISFFHEGSGSVKFGEVKIYEGLVDAWPERDQ